MLFLLFALALTPQNLPMQVLAQGPLSDIGTARQVVVRTEDEWQALWRQHGVTKLPPTVDFTQNLVAGVFLGSRPSSGYKVEISRAYADGQDLVIEYKVEKPAPGAMTAPIITSPYILVLLPAHPGPVRFVDVSAAHEHRH
ncbi:MAG: protease complex subunit PrcB family protein [Acidobacteriota bacterium]|nr:protease complex subunit PrcB family protein [Acidobacteriota bacterium]